jgi:ankyrin repeat protein
MRLLDTKTLELGEFEDRAVPDYAILSHRWEVGEVTLQDIKTDGAKKLQGYGKISNACSVAAAAGFEYVWIDTCCIDKTSSAELSEAINSMYRWYQEAGECYAYLADVPHNSVNRVTGVTGPEFRESRWFTRGWTLQELIAPLSVIFLDGEWQKFGTKSTLQQEISVITGIPGNFLLGDDLRHASVAQRMSWASKRETTRTEDLAYCLMGLFGIYMPMLYGEGERAFIRLQEEIMRISDDHSLFAWRSEEDHGGILAISPAAFADSGNIIPVSPTYGTSNSATLSSRGINLSLRFVNSGQQVGKGLAILHCTETGKERMRLALHLKDVFLRNEDFVREQSTTLELVNMENIDLSQHPLTSLYVRQWHPTRNKNWGGMEKCVVKLEGVDAKEAASHITNFDSNCNLSDGLIIINMKAISDGLLGRLAVMCKDGNIFQILLSKHGRSLSAIISSTTDLQHTKNLNVLQKEQNDQDQIVKVLNGGQHVHIAIKKRVLLLDGQRCLTGVVEISYSSTLKGVWLEHVAVLEKEIEERTLLSYAAKRGLKPFLGHLLDREGIESKSKDDLRTPLSWAAECGQEELVKHLLERGAAIESKDKHGRTPLSRAAESGYEVIVRLLLAKSAELLRAADLPRAGWQRLLPTKGTKFDSKRNDNQVSHYRPMSADIFGQTPLHYAAQNEHEAVVKVLLEKRADINTASKDGWTPLYMASKEGHIEVVKLLLEKGADINTATNNGWTPLFIASQNGHAEVVKLLLEKGVNIYTASKDGWTPLYLASQNGHAEVVKLLLEKGADINTADNDMWTPLSIASENGHVEVVKLLLEKGADVNTANIYGWTPLHIASQNGHVEVVKLLLEKGANINTANNDGWTPLHKASEHGHVEVVKLLLEKGADVNTANINMWTLLYIASRNGHVEVVKLLLEKGVDIDKANKYGWAPPLCIASENGHVEVIKLLLEKGANINAANNDGWTPLYFASQNGHVEVVKLLLEKGVDIDKANKYGWAPPLYIASKNGHVEVVKLLLEKGADVNTANIYGWTPLHIASKNGHVEVVKLLKEWV